MHVCVYRSHRVRGVLFELRVFGGGEPQRNEMASWRGLVRSCLYAHAKLRNFWRTDARRFLGSRFTDLDRLDGLAVKQLYAYARVSRKTIVGIDVRNSAGKFAGDGHRA